MEIMFHHHSEMIVSGFWETRIVDLAFYGVVWDVVISLLKINAMEIMFHHHSGMIVSGLGEMIRSHHLKRTISVLKRYGLKREERINKCRSMEGLIMKKLRRKEEKERKGCWKKNRKKRSFF
jgi:hypothetical protein